MDRVGKDAVISVWKKKTTQLIYGYIWVESSNSNREREKERDGEWTTDIVAKKEYVTKSL